MRVFAFQCENKLPSPAIQHLLMVWERETKGTELEGSRLLVVDGGAKIVELTGEGLEKVVIEDGRIVLPKEQHGEKL